jgi:hypothetical protein
MHHRNNIAPVLEKNHLPCKRTIYKIEENFHERFRTGGREDLF